MWARILATSGDGLVHLPPQCPFVGAVLQRAGAWSSSTGANVE